MIGILKSIHPLSIEAIVLALLTWFQSSANLRIHPLSIEAIVLAALIMPNL